MGSAVSKSGTSHEARGYHDDRECSDGEGSGV